MGFRKAHGYAKKNGRSIVWETPPSDEQRTAPEGAAGTIERTPAGKFTAAGAAAAGRRRAELAQLPDFANFELRVVPFEDWKPFDALRRVNYSKAVDDYVTQTGACSRRVRTILRGAAFLSASAEYWSHVFMTTGDARADERAQQRFKSASVEWQKAWDAACVEAEGRLKNGLGGGSLRDALGEETDS